MIKNGLEEQSLVLLTKETGTWLKHFIIIEETIFNQLIVCHPL